MIKKIRNKIEVDLSLLDEKDSILFSSLLDECDYPPETILSLSNSGITNLMDINKDVSLVKLLDISENPITTLKGIERFFNIHILIARKCQISSLSNEMSNLSKLFYVNLAENMLTENGLNQIGNNLVFIDVSRNKLSNWPDAIEKQNRIIFVYLTGNNLSRIITRLPTLKVVTVNQNNIKDVAFTEKCKPVKVNISHNKLHILDGLFDGLINAKIIDLGNNLITSIPNNIKVLQKLERFNIGGNEAKKIPECIGDLKNLKSLTANLMKLEDLPLSLSKLELDEINLSNNLFESIPDVLCKISSLKKLIIQKCRLKIDLPVELKKLNSLLELDLSLNYLNKISLENLPPSLIVLLAKSNRIKQIIGINGHQHLEVLDMRSNKLKELPKEMFPLPNLRVLNLTGNKIRELPLEFCSLASLKTLNFSRNPLTVLPQNFGQLNNLVDVNFFGNQIESLPSSIGGLEQLRSLSLVNNSLKEIPKEIGYLKHLRNLSVRKNKLSRIPLELAYLDNLEALNFDNNPLDGMPQIKGMGVSETISHLKKLQSGDSVIYTILLDEEIRLAFKQFLLLFKDFVEVVKNRKILYLVENIPTGLEVTMKADREVLTSLNEYFIEYSYFLKESSHELNFKMENYAMANSAPLTRLAMGIKNAVVFLTRTFQIPFIADQLNPIKQNIHQDQIVALKLDNYERRIDELTKEKNLAFDLLKDAINRPTMQIQSQVISGGTQQFADGITNTIENMVRSNS